MEILKLKNIILNSLHELIKRTEETEKTISKQEKRPTNIPKLRQTKEIKKTNKQKNEQILQILWDYNKRDNNLVMGVPKGEKKESGTEKFLKEEMSQNFPNWQKHKPKDSKS